MHVAVLITHHGAVILILWRERDVFEVLGVMLSSFNPVLIPQSKLVNEMRQLIYTFYLFESDIEKGDTNLWWFFHLCYSLQFFVNFFRPLSNLDMTEKECLTISTSSVPAKSKRDELFRVEVQSGSKVFYLSCENSLMLCLHTNVQKN